MIVCRLQTMISGCAPEALIWRQLPDTAFPYLLLRYPNND
jgi:hypothetical protein